MIVVLSLRFEALIVLVSDSKVLSLAEPSAETVISLFLGYGPYSLEFEYDNVRSLMITFFDLSVSLEAPFNLILRCASSKSSVTLTVSLLVALKSKSSFPLNTPFLVSLVASIL